MPHLRGGALAAVFLFIATAAAAEYVPYSELRKINSPIDPAVASLPTSDIQGTFNQISAQLRRSKVKKLTEGAWVRSELPNNFEPGMVAALEDLRSDIVAGFDTPPLETRLILLQVIDFVVVRRLVELHAGYDDDPCIPLPPPENEPCPDLRPPVIVALDQALAELHADVVDMLDFYNDLTASTEPIPEELTSQNFTSVVGTLLDTFGFTQGVPEIQD